MSTDDAQASDIDVNVQVRFIDGESDAAKLRFVFAYTITVSNHGGTSVQLVNRYWLITNGEGQAQEVRGPGVVGKQPHIGPDESFRYTSAAVLETAVGSMQGHYEMVRPDGSTFQVPIPAFSLAMPNAVH